MFGTTNVALIDRVPIPAPHRLRSPWTNNCAKAALEYHRLPTPGKISVAPTKELLNQRDLALAYTPGVAAACEAIVADPAEARNLTARGNLVARDHQRHRGARAWATSARSPPSR